MTTIADRIKASRSEQFVGRVDELALFDRVLTGEESQLVLLHFHAPAGVGKTTLLRELEHRSKAYRTVWVDGKAIVPTVSALAAALQADASSTSGKTVYFVDEYDALLPLDTWFRETFVSGLPSDSLVVLAGRDPLSNRWRSDPAWQQLSKGVPLRNLTVDEQRIYLVAQSIPDDLHAKVIEFTRGHPLALSLLAANMRQNQDLRIEVDSFPNVIGLLLERFLDNVPSAKHRLALQAASVVRVTTEAILANLVDEALAFELFEWLRGLSFMQVSPQGLYPQDLARETVEADLRWRNPDLHAKLHERARRYYSDRLGRTRGETHRAVVGDYIYLHRDNPTVKPFFSWDLNAPSFLDQYSPKDRKSLLAMVEEHEGRDSAAILDFWLDRQPENVVVLRSTTDTESIEGFLLKLEIASLSASELEADPGSSAACKHLKDHAPLRKGETATLFRFWMDRQANQGVSISQGLIFVAMIEHSLASPGPAHTFVPSSIPDFWMPIFTYSTLNRIPHADFQVGSVTYGMFGHDWRAMTPKAWLDLLSERELSTSPVATEPKAAADVVLLSREAFDAAVLDALKNFSNGAKLGANPLLRSRLVTSRIKADAELKDRVESLRVSICAVADSWKVSGREAKLFDALEHGYIRPAATQDKAAELLDLSIATFRRHLQSAIGRLSDGLWEIEIGR